MTRSKVEDTPSITPEKVHHLELKLRHSLVCIEMAKSSWDSCYSHLKKKSMKEWSLNALFIDEEKMKSEFHRTGSPKNILTRFHRTVSITK